MLALVIVQSSWTCLIKRGGQWIWLYMQLCNRWKLLSQHEENPHVFVWFSLSSKVYQETLSKLAKEKPKGMEMGKNNTFVILKKNINSHQNYQKYSCVIWHYSGMIIHHIVCIVAFVILAIVLTVCEWHSFSRYIGYLRWGSVSSG